MNKNSRLTKLAVVLVLVLIWYACNTYILVPMNKNNEVLSQSVSNKDLEIRNKNNAVLSYGSNLELLEDTERRIAECSSRFYTDMTQEEYINEINRFVENAGVNVDHIVGMPVSENDDSSACTEFEVSGVDTTKKIYDFLAAIEGNEKTVGYTSLAMNEEEDGEYRFTVGISFTDIGVSGIDPEFMTRAQSVASYTLPIEFLSGSYRNIDTMGEIFASVKDFVTGLF